jgi:acetolactate synthase-1/2/3 large subunit
MTTRGSGGALLVSSLRRHGIDTLFTLNGGHLFPVYDACARQGLRVVDVRHEQTAVFAAEGLARLTRRPAVAALTAGPGVTNGLSGIASAFHNGAPVLVLGGRAPQARWGSGSLQEMDHLPLVRSITKHARTVLETAQLPAAIDEAIAIATRPHRGPVFLDVPVDALFQGAELALPALPPATAPDELDPELVATVSGLLAAARAPVLVAGSDLHWAGAWEALRALAEAARIPVYTSGLGRGSLHPGHPLAFARSRSLALKQADLVIVVGTPLDFRLGFGRFGAARVVHLVDAPEAIARHVELAAGLAGDLGAILGALADAVGEPAGGDGWLEQLRAEERRRRAEDEALLRSDAAPIHPARILGELAPRLAQDAILIGDGGDFVSFAGRLLEAGRPGCWQDAGPFGCLGSGLGYALAARLAAGPRRQVVLLVGDGALGFSAMEFDTLVRFRLPVLAICGNNGIWGLEKHPMKMLYGQTVATDLQPGCRYDQVVEALGGHGELVERAEQIGPAIDRALASDRPALVNVLTDPGVAYPRSANLL